MEALLRSLHLYRRGLGTTLIAFGLGFAAAPAAFAEPTDTTPPDPGAPGPVVQYYPGGDPMSVPVESADGDSPAVAACHQFGAALDVASTYYGNFADTIDGSVRPDYSDPTVSDTNTVGRTALRQAAATAMSAANTPGLTPDMAGPMRSWSFGATKLLLKMGLRTGGSTMNDTATSMNEDAGNAQMACANAGTHA